nr:hypothetical protein [Rhodococcus wratislaviensis]GLK37886.1 hypothetical protein GCM10017611_47510 [Rhodococcus wratislaviensis]
MTRWHPLAPTEDTFFTTAPMQVTHTAHIPAPKELMWRTLIADTAVHSWAQL